MSRSSKAAKVTPVQRLATTADVCEEFTVERHAVNRWAADGCPHDGGGGKGKPRLFNIAEVAAWMRANGVTGTAGRPPEVSPADDPDGSLLAVNIRKQTALAATYELRLERERGELVSKAEVEAGNVRLATVIRNKLLAIPAAVAPALAGLSVADMEQVIEDRVRSILTELSQS